ncbi:MAG TPA: DUF2798 domain-containing protein [Steroidobacteraceae bacterium]|nr:DUF2798 domain-containing protein [Steroidobacteraceae bacterium]
MQISSRYAPLLFGAFLSAIMVAIVSAFVLATTQGLHSGFAAQWLRSCLTTWPVAFPTVTLVAPWVRKLVVHLTVQRPAVQS